MGGSRSKGERKIYAMRMQQNKMQPMISVLMGIYYRREDTGLLHRSIRSILAQTYSNLEMIICDDGSTEAAQKVIQQYAGKDPRIHLVRNGNLITLPQNFYFGVRHYWRWVGIRRINTACCARIMIYCFVCMSTAIGGQICRNGSLTIPSLKRQKEVGECPIGGMNQ